MKVAVEYHQTTEGQFVYVRAKAFGQVVVTTREAGTTKAAAARAMKACKARMKYLFDQARA